MERELQNYYENRFSMMSTQGWKDLMEDTKKMFDSYNQVNSVASYEDFHYRKGQLDILQWVLSLQKVSEDTYEELSNEEAL